MKIDLQQLGWNVISQENNKIYAIRDTTKKKAVFFTKEPTKLNISNEYKSGFHPFTIKEEIFDNISNEFVKQP